MPPENVRKTALLASLLQRKQRQRLLSSLPTAVATELSLAIGEVERQGWAQREIVERALGETLSETRTKEGMELDGLVALSQHLDSAHFARILTATQLVDPEFVLAMLEEEHAEQVRASAKALPAMPEKLREAVRNHAQTMLDRHQARAKA
jgi:flagellar motor switch protein FliG